MKVTRTPPHHPLSFLFPHMAATYSPTYQIWLNHSPANAPCLCSVPDSHPKIEVLAVFTIPKFWAVPIPPSH